MSSKMFQDDLYLSVKRFGGELPEDEFGFFNLFDLRPFYGEEDPQVAVGKVREIGRKGGPLDAGDPRITALNPLDGAAGNLDNADNAGMTVGFTFLGQFIDHDLTFDPLPLVSPETNGKNLRQPFFNLDSVYGRGPDEDEFLYDRFSRDIKFFLDADASRDLPRNTQKRALIADPRNDENVMISQLQLAFLKMHNRVVNELRAAQPQAGRKEIFEQARKLVRWHFQWIVVHQFMPVTLDPEVFEQVQHDGPTIYHPDDPPKIPREFQVAAYRFGHSQIRPGYQPNPGFGGPIFDHRIDPAETDPNDMRGGVRGPRRFVDWNVFFDFGDGEVKKNKLIDRLISTPMFDLPVGPGLPGPNDNLRSLAGRNLERHVKHGLASGQAIADALGYTVLGADQFPELAEYGYAESTPLWYYILREAEVQHTGTHVGKVGSRLIAEVFFGLLLADPDSFLTQEPGWTPTLERRSGGSTGDFTMVDLLTYAGVA